ncbi:MAG: endopeptidase La [Gemmatimonadaceae bacterium]|nr:endopeptidase La [Gemmatimonadaceae bacterium]
MARPALRLPVLPLRDVIVFPHVTMPLLVGRAGSLAAIDAADDTDQRILLVAQRSAEMNDPGPGDLHAVGTVARIVQQQTMANGARKILVEAETRVTLVRIQAGERGLSAVPGPLPLAPATAEREVLGRRALSLFEEYVGLHRRIPGEVVTMVQATPSGERQAYALAAHLALRLDVRQRLLESPSLDALWQLLVELLSSELDLLRLERKLEDDVRGALGQNQREFWLQEQLKAIHRELGTDDDDVAEIEKQIAAKTLPAAAKERVERELGRLKRLSTLSPEAAVSRTWIEWALALPWTERSDDTLDIARAKAVLDGDHFGLDDVKDRIIDHIAVLKSVGTMAGPVLCLVGPPGVGKTSLGRSIATALGRKFVRMSLGGVRDEAEIRGHRRTYIGALPGRILQAMRKAGTVNPVILLDEVDKLGQDWRGDPSAALLEVLDPEQHAAFNDHYLELDYDLSQVLFLTTANGLAGIPEPLRDRMEIVRLPGYLDPEKIEIAKRFLWPRQLAAHGLEGLSVTVADDVWPALLRRYTREAGVRELDRRLARVARKLARRRAESKRAALSVKLKDLRVFLGPAPFDDERLRREDRAGVANGLAYTSVGGEVLEIEVSAVAGRGRVQLTGTLGDVMKESASAAISFARARAETLGIPTDFPRTTDLHVHIPDGATPKDGPSAGIALATAIISALTGLATRGDTAMTGEVTLRGRVLPIGGLKEKTVAALREGIRQVLIPKGNAREVEELPAEVREGLTIRVVSTMDEVLQYAFVSPPAAVVPSASPRRAGDRRGASVAH